MAPPTNDGGQGASGPVALLRIFTTERARDGGRPLYETVVLQARARKLAGVTVVRGAMGFGRSAHIQSANILDLSSDLPVIIEIVDDEAALRAFLPELAAMHDLALVTIERAEVLHRGARRAKEDG